MGAGSCFVRSWPTSQGRDVGHPAETASQSNITTKTSGLIRRSLVIFNVTVKGKSVPQGINPSYISDLVIAGIETPAYTVSEIRSVFEMRSGRCALIFGSLRLCSG